MINPLLPVYLCLLFSPLFSMGQSYQLRGNIQGLDADSLLLIKIQDGYALEKVPVAEGVFTYESPIEEPYFVQIMALDGASGQPTQKLTELMVEAGEIFIEGPAPIYDSIQVRGSEADRVLKAYFAADEALSEKWNALKLDYDKYKAAGDTTSRKAVAQQLNAITFEERIPLLKQYVQDHRNKIIGALIPNFCSLEEVLTKEDYLEMYQMLTPEIQQTDYGQSVKSRAQ